MKTISDLATRLSEATTAAGSNASRLHKATGLSYLTVNACLAGKKDPRFTTILALARELGLELVLVPREVAMTLEAQPNQPTVQTLVEKATQK